MTSDTGGSQTIDFFVSYAENDRSWAEWIGWQLEAAGYTVRLRAWDHDLVGGNRILTQDRDLAVAKRLIAVLSPSYHVSAESSAQWSAFLRADPAGEQRRIIPLEVAGGGGGGVLLRNLSPVSLVGLDRRAAERTLLAAVREVRLKPSKSPGYPGRQAPSFPESRRISRLKPDTKALLIFITLTAVVFAVGSLTYNGHSSDSGNMWRAGMFIVSLGVTIRMSRRWFHRRF